MKRLSHLFRRTRALNTTKARQARPRGALARQTTLAGWAEALERRSMLAVTVNLVSPAPNQPAGDLVEIVYNQPDAAGNTTTSGQNVTVEVEDVLTIAGAPTTRVSIYVSSNPLTVPPNTGVPAQAYTFFGVSAVSAVVPNYDDPGVNNNSLTIKGIFDTTDRIIMAGSGRTASGRWSDETDDEFWVSFDTQGIDDLTLTAGGVINVSGEFSNDTNDASIHAIATVPENATSQLTGTVVVGETTPAQGTLPHARLKSNYIEMIGAELDILSDIEATDQVILRAGENAPQAARSHLVLPYDVTVTGNVVTGTTGVLELFSTKNIEQLPSSTIIAGHVVAVSNNADVASLGGPWMISLGTQTNDFDTVSIGMTAAPGDAPNADTEGRVGIRDIDDLTVSDFGILASTGRVRIDTVGALTIAAPIQATGLILESDDSVVSLAGAVMRLGDEGISVLADDANGTASGDVTLAGPITIVDSVATALVTNKISAAGVATVAGGLYSPHAGSTTITGKKGVVVGGPIQVGSTKLNANSTTAIVFDHDLNLISLAGGVTVNNVPGNDATPFSIQATNIIAIDAVDTISIGGSIFAGTIYGDPDNLTATEALPAITIRGLADVKITETGSLRTQAYETDPAATSNPLVGKISIAAAARLDADGPISADGAVDITIPGDVYLRAPVTARENAVIRTTTGGIDVQGAIRSTGGNYDTVPAAGSQREPNVILDAPGGTIATSGSGTLTAGTVSAGGASTFGSVVLTAQQDIAIGADVNTPGAFTATSKLGGFDLAALLQTNNDSSMVINAGNGMVVSDADLGRIVASSLTLLNTAAAGGVSDIDLRAKNNQIDAVTATNLSVGGSIRIANNKALDVATAGITAQRSANSPSTIDLTSTGGITQKGPIQANHLVVSNTSSTAVTLANIKNDVDQFAGSNPSGSLTYSDANDFETGVLRSGPQTVEVIGDRVELSSAATHSIIRVVGGLKYRTLSLAAGNLGGTDVGTVEYVTTSQDDNPPITTGVVPAFAGTLRDMIRYANDNIATYLISGSNKPQPQQMVFDEADYDVTSIAVGRTALPAFTKPVTFDGGRLTDDVLGADPDARLGIRGTVASTPAGLTFGVGSNQSIVTRLAVGGFSRGSGLLLSGGTISVTNVWAGLDEDGVAAANRVGVEISGAAAVGNLVGSVVVDPRTANRMENNTAAGVLVRGGASANLIYGNEITGNGDGVRVNGASGTQIGAPDAVQPDLQPSTSNTITDNRLNGIQIMNSNAGTYTTANRVRNNRVDGNTGAGIAVVNSTFATIGATGSTSSNVVVNQSGSGITVSGSSDVRIRGNDIGMDDLTRAANRGDGVTIVASKRIDVSGGNRISGNTGSGVVIAQGSTAVNVAANKIGERDAGNGVDGVAIRASVGNTVGAGNVIGYNGRNGVNFTDARASTLSAGNRLVGSLIESNVVNGVYVSGGGYSTIGGTKAGDGNEIQGNLGKGIALEWNGVTGSPTGYAIQGNYIGTNTNREVGSLGNGGAGIAVSGGTAVVISDSNVVMNNAGSGIVLEGGARNSVGVGQSGNGNAITANSGSGVTVRASALALMPATLRAAKHHTISGALVSENGGSGVLVTGVGTTGIVIGNAVTPNGVTGVANTIAGNRGYGVALVGAVKQVGFQGNEIYENDLGAFSVPSVANPLTATSLTITSAVVRSVGSTAVLTINATGQGAANQQYSIDVYANSPDDGDYDRVTDPNLNSRGYQARRFLGRVTVIAGSSGTFSLKDARITAPVEVGEVITMTATSLRFNPGSTSALSSINATADLPGIPTPRPPY